jgi:hypothetical protein
MHLNLAITIKYASHIPREAKLTRRTPEAAHAYYLLALVSLA